MPLTTTEVPTFFGPPDSPLFGVVQEHFTAKGGRAALDRLQWTSQPPRLIAAPTGDHSAHHPAILAAIRNAVLPVAAPSPSEHIPVSDIMSIGSGA